MLKRLGYSVIALIALVVATVGQARADMAALFTAADVSGLSTNINAMLVLGVGVALLFVAYKFVKKGMNKL